MQKLIDAIPNNAEDAALLFYAQTLYYSFHNDENRVWQLVRQSIDAFPGLVRPHEKLGEIYKDRGLIHEAYYHFSEALKNIKHIPQDDEFFNFLSIDGFVNEYLKGTILLIYVPKYYRNQLMIAY